MKKRRIKAGDSSIAGTSLIVLKMLRFITLLCLATACLAFPQGVPQLDGRIVGGSNADIRDYPYQVSMEIGGSHSCGASIISNDWVLTAAHCSGGLISNMLLRAGSSTRGVGGVTRTVTQKIIHNLYNSGTTDYDLTLLRVSSPWVYQSGIAAIALPTDGQNTAAGTNSVVTGWGTTSSGGTLATTLQMVNIPVTSDAVCESAYGAAAITPQMICAGIPAGGIDSCQGDSGGPMKVGSQLIGVVSWGRGCALPNFPGVYAKVSSMRAWIRTNSGV